MMNFIPVGGLNDTDLRTPSRLRKALTEARSGPLKRMTKNIRGELFSFAWNPASIDSGSIGAFDRQWLQAGADVVEALQGDRLSSFIQHEGGYLRVPGDYWDDLHAECWRVVNGLEQLTVWPADNLISLPPEASAYENCAVFIPGEAADRWVAANAERREDGPVVEPVAFKTGLAGRHNTSEVALGIMRERAATGDILPTLAGETSAIMHILLSDARYAAVPKVTEKGLGNGLRDEYKALRGARNP